MGLGICYDMRFAELAQIYAQRGEAAVHSCRFESGLAFVGRGSPSLENLEERSYSLRPILLPRLLLCLGNMEFWRF